MFRKFLALVLCTVLVVSTFSAGNVAAKSEGGEYINIAGEIKDYGYDDIEYNYAKLLQYALYMYDANMCGGTVEQDSLFDWRGDCHTYDKTTYKRKDDVVVNVDVTGGYHDSGDHAKWGLPEAYAAFALENSFYTDRDAYEAASQVGHFETIVNRFVDYFERCMVLDAEENVEAFVTNVGEGDLDHEYWGAPEEQPKEQRGGVFFATADDDPSTDIVSLVAATLALHYLNFEDEDSLISAQKLFEFAKNNPKAPNMSAGVDYYRSNGWQDNDGWQDDYCLAALLLYKITGEDGYNTEYQKYKNNAKAKNVYWAPCWDNVAPLLLYHANDTGAVNTVASMGYSYATCGIWLILDYGSLRYNTGLQYMGLMYDRMTGSSKYKDDAEGQMKFILGNNPEKQCFVLGYNDYSFEYPYHRAAAGYDEETFKQGTVPPAHLLIGALAGGPNASGQYRDFAYDFQCNEPAIDYNANFVMAAAAHLTNHIDDEDQVIDPNYYMDEEPDEGYKYLRVASEDDLIDGARYLIVSDKNVLNGSLDIIDDTNNIYVVDDADYSENQIIASEEVHNAAFTISPADGTVTSVSKGYNIGNSGNNNGLYQGTSYRNEISIDSDGNALLKAISTGNDRYLRFNKTNNQNRFRYFLPNSQNPIQLFIYRPDAEHEHNFEFTLGKTVSDNDTIFANCQEEDCFLPENSITLTINAPEHAKYGDGKEAAATLSGIEKFNAVTNLAVSEDSITYKGTGDTEYEESTTAPEGAGSYMASITADGTTAYVEYTVDKVAPSYTKPQKNTNLEYTGASQALVTAGSVTGGTMLYAIGEDSETVPGDDAFSESVPKGKDADTYYVWYKINGDPNHKDVVAKCIEVPIDKGTTTVSAKDITMKVGESAKINAMTTSDGNIVYEYDETGIITVDSQGNVKGLKKGEATVTVIAEETDNYYAGSTEIKVTVNEDTPEPVVKKFTVTFNANGHGKAPATQKVESGKKAKKPANPTASGYKFEGWYTTKACKKGTEYNWSTPVTKNITLYAKWTKNVNVKTVDMLRLYNPNSGEHFYTASAAEKDTLVKAGWQYEGLAWKAPEKSNTPVYRVYNANAGDHHYTISKAERDTLVAAGWKDEGIGWYSDDAKTVPIYRVYNPNAKAGSHHFTFSKSEVNELVKAGWKDEGIAWYGKQ